MSTAKIIPFPIERVRAKAVLAGDGALHRSNVAIDASSSSPVFRAEDAHPETSRSPRLKNPKLIAARGLAAEVFVTATDQSELRIVEVAACFNCDEKKVREIRDAGPAFEVGHLFLLPEAAALRALDEIKAVILARRRR